MASFRIPDADRYVRLHYENDFFTATDYYFTQGINIEFVHPNLRKFPLSKLIRISKKYNVQYGIAVEHIGFTPTSIRHDDIIYGDRPFAGALFLKTFNMHFNQQKRIRITTTLSTGVLGTAASGMWMQKSIHKWLNNIEPLGWQHQIKNDILINYEISYEKNLIGYKNYFLVNGIGRLKVGTLSDKVSVGGVIMAGKLNVKTQTAFLINGINPVGAEKEKLNFHIYLQPLISAIRYDATMQGGLFNHSSPYTLSANEINRFTFQGNGGFVLTYKWLYLEYFQSYLTKEFKTGIYHRWGGIRIGINV